MGRPPPPPIVRAMPERKRFFSIDVFPNFGNMAQRTSDRAKTNKKRFSWNFVHQEAAPKILLELHSRDPRTCYGTKIFTNCWIILVRIKEEICVNKISDPCESSEIQMT